MFKQIKLSVIEPSGEVIYTRTAKGACRYNCLRDNAEGMADMLADHFNDYTDLATEGYGRVFGLSLMTDPFKVRAEYADNPESFYECTVNFEVLPEVVTTERIENCIQLNKRVYNYAS